ncbi:hypothetical protein [Nonomuraea typhae]|uniref:hypothetical protein n=1 Tax=Nonomuraea typhae TaxID=2603600 RepID=UPI0012F7C056|nr:hypothetical protein [Nonomuraea typhae]
MAQSGDKRGVVFAAIVVVVAAVGLYVTMWPGARGSEPTPGPATSAAPLPPATSAPLATASNAPFDIYAYLPMSRQQLAAAAELAERFTASYGTFRYDEEPAVYANRVKAFTTGELATYLTKALTSPGSIEQNKNEQTVATATARMKEIRQVGKTSIVFIITSTQKLAGKSGVSERAEDLAVTLTPVGNDWRVFDVQPAGEGQDGDPQSGDPEG